MDTDSAFIYLDPLLDKGEQIYVRNTSQKPARGIVVLTLNDNGRTVREAIPATKYPVCLSRKATPDMIRNSSSLRQFLDAGALQIVPQEQAEKELRAPGALEDLAAAFESIGYKNRDIMRVRGRNNDIKMVDSDHDGDAGPIHTQLDATVAGQAPEPFSNEYNTDFEVRVDESRADGPSVRVEGLVEALASKDMKSRQVKAELQGLELSANDLAYIVDKTSGIVQKYAKEQLSQLGASDVGGYIEEV